jgi:RNA polymerase sigma-70 factor (ECF subfamily)
LAEPADHERAFEAAFSEHYARVYGVLFRLLGDRAEAEDLTVETFWRLWQRAPRRAENLAGWLYRVAMRLGFNALRASRRRVRYELEAGHEALAVNTPPNPADVVERSQERAAVRAVLDQMKPRDAQLLLMRHSGLSYAEIAAALGLAPGSVGTLLARAEAEFELRYTP